MSHKVSPIAHRLGGIIDWKSRWFNTREYRKNLKEDVLVREFLKKHLRAMGIASVEIERHANTMSIILATSRPGLIIGRGGAGVEELRKKILSIIVGLRKDDERRIPQIRLEVKEIRTPELYAELVAQQIAEQLERRAPFRRTIKQSLDRVMSQKAVEGVRIMVKGRLDGREMARKEWVMAGRLPLQTIRADIDYAHVNANTNFGVIGVKTWIYKGDKLDSPKN